MESLFKIEQNESNYFLIGSGFALRILSDTHVHVYRNGILDKDVEFKEQIDKRVLVVDLVEKHGVKKIKLSQALNISRQSIDNWVSMYRKHGLQGLLNNTKDSWKKNPKRFTGNKARQLEEERKEEREQTDQQMISINYPEEELIKGEELSTETAELFTETHDYEENRYAGSYIYWSMFQHNYQFIGLLDKYTGKYGVMVWLFAMMQINRISSIEQLKTVFKGEFGRLLGMRKLFSHPIIWKQIHELVNLKKSSTALKDLFRMQIKKGLVSIYELFLDGHHLPYSGQEKVHKSFFTQRDMMMPGQTELFIHDHLGQVVYFDIQEGKGDMVKIIKEVSSEWVELNHGIVPLIVVDRELWGVEKFVDMKECRFVTWEKFCDNEILNEISQELFTAKFEKRGIEYKVFEENKTYHDNEKRSVTLRRVIFWNMSTNERRALVSNDTLENAETIAHAMLKRWGSNENTFKFMGERIAMHYNPVIDISKESEKQKVINPEYKELEKQQKQVKVSLSKIEKTLGKIKIVINNDGTLRKNEKREDLLVEKKLKEGDLQQIKQAIGQCPQHIDLRDIKTSKEELFKVIDKEGKNWWDLSAAIVWNSRKKLIEILRVYLPNERDLIPVLEAITKSKGWIKNTPSTIIVRLEPLERPQFCASQIQLCRYLNNLNVRINGKLLQYDVADDPYKMSKN